MFFFHRRFCAISAWTVLVCLSVAPQSWVTVGLAQSSDASAPLDPSHFTTPPKEYRPIDCWWWEQGELTRERLRWQLEQMHAQGVGGTWLYPRFGASQPQSSEPGFWTDGWWEFVRFALDEHERLGMVQYANDWLGRLDKSYFQSRLREQSSERTELVGQRLVAHRVKSSAAEKLQLRIPDGEQILSAAAYRLREAQENMVDGASREDLTSFINGQEVVWDAPEPEWLMVVVTSQPHSLNYLGPAVAKRWIEIFFDQYRQQLGDRLGKSLVAYGPDERSVLSGNILYSAALRERIQQDKGYDPLPELAALFIDVGPETDRLRCQYYDALSDLLEKNLYEPMTRWLHEHRMKHVTIATWGREDLLGQTSNYGDFPRMMKHFDMPGNEDSLESGPNGAFIDTKLSSSIAHLNNRSRVAVCAYWGMGWGFTQEQNIARTNINYALGTNLYNTHGVSYSLLAGRNEFVPPDVHFYQPYWQTWRTFTDYVSRLSYALSQGEHRADVALLYPLSTIHAHWHSGSQFDPAAKTAQTATFSLARSLYAAALDFDFVDESRLAEATVAPGILKVSGLEFPAIVIPTITTLRADVMARLQQFVAGGGTLVVLQEPPRASAEAGRDDPEMVRIWTELLGDYRNSREPLWEHRNAAGGRTILVRGAESDVATAIRSAIDPDVMPVVPDLMHTHQQVGDEHLYFFVNRRPERRVVDLSVRCSGTPEIWDAESGKVHPHYRFESVGERTRLVLDMEPHAGLLVVLRPDKPGPQVIQDSFARLDEVRPHANGYEVVGIANASQDVQAKVVVDGQTFVGQSAAPSVPEPIPLNEKWQCEYRQTMDNRWGDFRYPASNEVIGPEAPRMKYRAEPMHADGPPNWQKADLPDDDWQQVDCTFGPYWQVLGPLESQHDSAELRQKILEGTVNPTTPVELSEKSVSWQPYAYSWRYGANRSEIHQAGNDGLGPVSPDFFVFDAIRGKPIVRYLASRVFSPVRQTRFLDFGGPRDKTPRQAWVNGQQIVNVDEKEANAIGSVELKAGWNHVVLRLPQQPGKMATTFAVFHESPQMPEQPRFLPISRWYESSEELIFDYRADGETSVGWYRFLAPPGAQQAKLHLKAKSVEAWVNGNSVEVIDNAIVFPTVADQPSRVAQVALRVTHLPGHYEGAAFTAPVEFVCGRGEISLGDWCQSGLKYYSGGVKYLRRALLSKEQLKHRVLLDLGDVRTSAEVTINGRKVGVRLARPFVFDITAAAKLGENEIQVEVLNTLANFMSATPSRYVYEGQTASGLLGPAVLRFERQVTLLLHPEPATKSPAEGEQQ